MMKKEGKFGVLWTGEDGAEGAPKLTRGRFGVLWDGEDYDAEGGALELT